MDECYKIYLTDGVTHAHRPCNFTNLDIILQNRVNIILEHFNLSISYCFLDDDIEEEEIEEQEQKTIKEMIAEFYGYFKDPIPF